MVIIKMFSHIRNLYRSHSFHCSIRRFKKVGEQIEVLWFSLLIVLALLTSSCSINEAKKIAAIAERSVEEFHVLFNAKKYSEIYIQADDTFRRSGSETDFVYMMNKVLPNVKTKFRSIYGGDCCPC